MDECHLSKWREALWQWMMMMMTTTSSMTVPQWQTVNAITRDVLQPHHLVPPPPPNGNAMQSESLSRAQIRNENELNILNMNGQQWRNERPNGSEWMKEKSTFMLSTLNLIVACNKNIQHPASTGIESISISGSSNPKYSSRNIGSSNFRQRER